MTAFSGNTLIFRRFHFYQAQNFTTNSLLLGNLYNETLLSRCLIHKFSNPAIVALNPAPLEKTLGIARLSRLDMTKQPPPAGDTFDDQL
ncbi:MAG: hypothetical protein L3J36_00580 [Rhodobacteraceae bacterium]|nr:hypothetical protein [Paracoccaceae bacterium]